MKGIGAMHVFQLCTKPTAGLLKVQKRIYLGEMQSVKYGSTREGTRAHATYNERAEKQEYVARILTLDGYQDVRTNCFSVRIPQ